MLCDECKTRPKGNGIKGIRCWVCGSKETVDCSYMAYICEGCSQEDGLCMSCGKPITENIITEKR